MPKLNGAHVLCQSLLKEKVEVIFGYPGGVLIPLYDVLPQYPLRHILVRHEQGAAFAADGYARVTNRAGVCLATSGPGATNLVTGIANAYMDSIPLVALTGQVANPVIGSDAFQEIDITGITQPITKHNYLVESVTDLPKIVKEAFHIAQTGRPGPVLVDLPVDVLKAPIHRFNYPKSVQIKGYKPIQEPKKNDLKKAAAYVNQSKRPIILAGHGIKIAGAEKELAKLVQKANLPVITTLLGMGAFSDLERLNFGMLGMHGMAYANFAVHNADLIIGLGLRFDDRITSNIEQFAQGAHVIHVDIDPAELGKNRIADVPICADVKETLQKLAPKVQKADHAEWIAQIKKWLADHPLATPKKITPTKPNGRLRAHEIINNIYSATKGQAIIASDVGQNQMWTAQHYYFCRSEQLLSSGGLGPMGYGLPAAIGAKIAKPEEEVWAIIGDGGFQINIQELGTILQEKLAIKIVILNNTYLGMVRQWQEMFYKKNYSGTPLKNPDFLKVAAAYDIPAFRAAKFAEAEKLIQKARRSKGPILLEFRIEPEENVLPMVPPGAPLKDTLIK